MNYEEQVLTLMKHLGDNYTPQGLAALTQALATGLARTVALIPDHDQMHLALVKIADAMHITACAEHLALHPEQAPLTAEDFLRDVFKPEKFHG